MAISNSRENEIKKDLKFCKSKEPVKNRNNNRTEKLDLDIMQMTF